MRTGVLIPSPVVASSRHLVPWARTAEDAGFDVLAVRGRIVLESLEPLVALSLVAAVTRGIEIVVHLDVPHVSPPRILARQIAALDRASRGRVNVAVGTDSWTFTDRDQKARSLTIVDLTSAGGATLDRVRGVLDSYERAGADDVLLGVPSVDLRELERLTHLRTASFV